eukprot:TRINITY_DN71524_c0_g1_i1.p2 TRINITY_DN71524_c0_g1~~TRINITY_DN71524_c0_g1_i1.p2  ORF type:complete len:127 (-),score=20.82 TRINITY_DN71524_c0_g1_i1:203-583(-)
MVRAVLFHCESTRYQEAIESLVDAIPTVFQGDAMIEMLAQHGFAQKAVMFLNKWSLCELQLQNVISTCDQVVVVRAASTRLQGMAQRKLERLEQRIESIRAANGKCMVFQQQRFCQHGKDCRFAHD